MRFLFLILALLSLPAFAETCAQVDLSGYEKIKSVPGTTYRNKCVFHTKKHRDHSKQQVCYFDFNIPQSDGRIEHVRAVSCDNPKGEHNGK